MWNVVCAIEARAYARGLIKQGHRENIIRSNLWHVCVRACEWLSSEMCNSNVRIDVLVFSVCAKQCSVYATVSIVAMRLRLSTPYTTTNNNNLQTFKQIARFN